MGAEFATSALLQSPINSQLLTLAVPLIGGGAAAFVFWRNYRVVLTESEVFARGIWGKEIFRAKYTEITRLTWVTGEQPSFQIHIDGNTFYVQNINYYPLMNELLRRVPGATSNYHSDT